MRRTRCAHCKGKLNPERPSQIVHAECAADWAIAQAEKRERAEEKKARMAAKVERSETRRRKEAVEVIENNNVVRKWTADELRSIRDHYKQKLKQLKKESA